MLLCLPNGPEALTAFLSVAAVSTVLPVAPEEPEAVIQDLFERLPISAVLYDAQRPGVFANYQKNNDLQRLPVDISEQKSAGIWSFASGITKTFRAESTTTSDAAVLIRTAGSVSKSKVVAWSQNSILRSSETAADWMKLNASDRSLCLMPISHLHSVVRSCLPGLMKGGSVVCAPGFDR